MKINKRNLAKKILVFGFVGQMFLTSSCALLLVGAAAGAAVAGTAWYLGSLSGVEQTTPKQVETATLEAFKDLKISKKSVATKTMESVIEGENSEGRGVTVTAKLQQDGKTKITIRVGTFGDRDSSEQLYAKIRDHLKIS